MKKIALVFVALFVLVLAAPVLAQTPVTSTPTTVQFTPSADHNTVLSDGTAMLTRYELRVYVTGTTQVVGTLNLAKPAPSAGTIAVVNAAWFLTLPKKTELVGKVAAIGPGGEGVSTASAPFYFPAPTAAVADVVIK